MKTPELDWTVVGAPGPLGEDQVHVWRIQLDLDAESSPAVLSVEEKEKAARFRFDRDRRRFSAAHAALRVILAGYLNLKPQEVQFTNNSYGKPYLAGSSTLFFNLSHSHELALLAVALRREVGVDVEYIRQELVEPAVIRRYFAPAEVAALAALPAGVEVGAFFNIWTRKEAFIKARGMGLSLPLDQFDVSVYPNNGEVVLKTYAEPEQADLWSIQAFHPAPEYAAAVAAQGRDWVMVGYEWNGGLPAGSPAAEQGEGL